MARRILLNEFPAELRALEVAIKARWPWLATSINEERLQLDIEAEDVRVSGMVSLDSVRGSSSVLQVRSQMSGGGGIVGTLAEAEDAMFCCRAVLDALHLAQARLGKLEVHAFDMPCATCTGLGKA